jgi:hypothetical protein
MPYTIVVTATSFEKKNDETVVKLGSRDCILYLSSSWDNLAFICSKHPFSANCNCSNNKVYIWDVENSLHQHFGKTVANNAKRALRKLFQFGVTILVPDFTITSWRWTDDLCRADRLGVFAYHLNNLCKFGEQHPTSCFLASNDKNKIDVDYLILPNKDIIKINLEQQDKTNYRNNLATQKFLIETTSISSSA